MSGERCGHFSIDIDQLPLPGSEVPLRVPIRRCRLTERMVITLVGSEAGRHAASRLITASSQALLATGNALAPEQVVAAFGPDLEAIQAEDCTAERCQLHCTPGYRRLLTAFGYEEEGKQPDASSCAELPLLSYNIFVDQENDGDILS